MEQGKRPARRQESSPLDLKLDEIKVEDGKVVLNVEKARLLSMREKYEQENEHLSREIESQQERVDEITWRKEDSSRKIAKIDELLKELDKK